MEPPAPLSAQRVYEANAVDAYVETMHLDLASLRAQLDEAVHLAEDASAKVAATQTAEALLGRALLSVQRATEDAVADARRDADRLLAQADAHAREAIAAADTWASEKVADAQHQADRIMAEANERADAHFARVRLEADRIIAEAKETVEALFAAATPAHDSTPAPPRVAPPDLPERRPPVRLTTQPTPAPNRGAAAAPPVRAWPAPDPTTRVEPPRDAIASIDPGENWRHVADRLAGVESRLAELRRRREDYEGGPEMTVAEAVGTALAERPLVGAASVTPATASVGVGADVRPMPFLHPSWSGAAASGRQPETTADPAPDRSAPLADLRDRWRFATTGTMDDDVLFRKGHLESLHDGSYVAELRGEDTPPPTSPTLRRHERRWRKIFRKAAS